MADSMTSFPDCDFQKITSQPTSRVRDLISFPLIQSIFKSVRPPSAQRGNCFNKGWQRSPGAWAGGGARIWRPRAVRVVGPTPGPLRARARHMGARFVSAPCRHAGQQVALLPDTAPRDDACQSPAYRLSSSKPPPPTRRGTSPDGRGPRAGPTRTLPQELTVTSMALPSSSSHNNFPSY